MPLNFVAKAAITAGLTLAQIALGASRKIEGPRLDSLKVTVAEYGTPLDDFWGIRRLAGRPMIWADDLREEKKKSKTKGGKYSEYKYFGSWAVAIAGHEIDGVSRIWFDEHLVYQLNGPGPVAAAFLAMFGGGEGAVVKIAAGRNMRIYKGTDTQQPDPLIEAWMEDEPDFGANCVSAMRGTAYIVFEDIPLEKFGNRIPTVAVEAVRGKTDPFPWEIQPTAGLTEQAYFSPDFSRLVFPGGSSTSVWDVATRTKLYDAPFGGAAVAVIQGGGFYTRPNDLVFVGEGGGGTVVAFAADIDLAAGSSVFRAGRALWLNGVGANAYLMTAVLADPIVQIPIGFKAQYYFDDADDDGIAWVSGETGTPDEFGIASLRDGAVLDSFTVAGAAVGVAPAAGMDNGNGQLLMQHGSYLMLVDKETGAVVTGPVNRGATGQVNFRGTQPGDETIWVGFSEISTLDLSVIRTLDPASWAGTGSDASQPLYDPINHAIWTRAILGNTTIRFLDRIGSDGVLLQEIVEDEGAGVNCTITAPALDQVVRGWSVAPGAAKDRIAPLLDLHDSMIRPHDFGMQGLKRGTSSLGTIAVSKFVRNDPRYEVDITQDNELAQRLEVKYAAIDNDQEINNVIAMRHTGAVDTTRVTQIDLSTYADTADAMQQKADRFLRRLWNSRATVTNGLTAQYLVAEPGDIYDLDLDGVLWTCELEKINYSAGALNCSWRRTFPSLNALGSGTAPDVDGRPPDIIFIPSQTRGFVLDIPLVQDADNDINPVIYVAAGKYTANWTGAVAWEGSDGTYDDDVAGISSSQAATWGYASDALGDANPCLWDRGNTLEVVVYGDTLSNSSEAAINADPSINRMALGRTGRWEILNFTTATLTGSTSISRTYALSGFLRGRRGTELNVGNHEAGDSVLMLADAIPADLGADTIGDNLRFKVQTLGLDPEAASAIDMEPYTAASLKPYAPVIDSIEKLDTGDIEITIRTRTRIGGSWNGSTIPTGETIADYEFDVYDGDTFKRTLDSTTKVFTYTAADQTTDFGSELDPEDIEGFAYQLSATVGRGFARAA